MNLRRTLTALAALLVCSIGIAPIGLAQGSSSNDLTTRIRGAERALVGRVVNVQPAWQHNKWGDELIVSRLSVQIEESLKGGGIERVLDVDVEGGTLGGITLRVSHTPQLKAGDRAVMLIDRGSAGVYVPHQKGWGVLPLDASDRVVGTPATLADVRAAARAALQ